VALCFIGCGHLILQSEQWVSFLRLAGRIAPPWSIEWDPETLQEGRYDVAKNMKVFEEANYRTA
jgi:hypothetical protein